MESVKKLFVCCAGRRSLPSIPTTAENPNTTEARQGAFEKLQIWCSSQVAQYSAGVIQLSAEAEDSGQPTTHSVLETSNSKSHFNNSTGSDSDDSSWEEELYRWGPFQDIPDSSFAPLAAGAFYQDEQGAPFVVESRVHGAHSFVVILSNGPSKLAVKIPIVGTKDRWNPKHKPILVSEADTIQWVRDQVPHFPVAEVLDWDTTLDNDIGAPYSCWSFIQGKSANAIWWDSDDEEETEGGESKANTDNDWIDDPSEECEQRRHTFLLSLARTMAELRHVSMDAIGMLELEGDSFDEPTINPIYTYIGAGPLECRSYREMPVFRTASAFWQEKLERVYYAAHNPYSQGLRFVLELIVNSPPFVCSKASPHDEEESFTLYHPDLALQNILVADDGKILGILDWEGAFFAPRCVGHICLPAWLQEGWLPVASDIPAGEIRNLSKYREIYTNAMIEACGGPESDAKYTMKSGLYASVVYTLFSNFGPSSHDKTDKLVKTLFRKIPALCDASEETLEEFIEKVGNGSLEGRKILEWIPKLIDHRTS
ncbi:hypothetical protein P171DRAFT_468684 [Karstenula rhodostoma CBS 690.94]|uniref:Aminoglycoside phosphotransferase domain-containing protein n=1 Tax=Karstenula rhodostoma CBS 690.94 TaxID=1392251 RepID=A0A9P4PS54_9PLEO|nr:hypothetical protein P171DRAFT_468684 [Karstenula rhodostoma CBS 690.94]